MNWFILLKRYRKFQIWTNELRRKVSEYLEKLLIQLKNE